MKRINFKPEFVDKILSGEKRMTMRWKSQRWLPGEVRAAVTSIAGKPAFLIPAKELSADVGLLEVASTGTMLRTIKKAPHRDVQIPDELYRYILMCRAVVKSEFEQEDAVAYWKRYVQESEESKGIGLAASKKIAQAYRAMEQQVTEAQNIVAKYDKHREALTAIGINPDDRWDSAFRQKLQELDGPLTKWHIERLKDIQKYASQILDTLVPQEPL